VLWQQSLSALFLDPIKEKMPGGSGPPRLAPLSNDYSNSFGISGFRAFPARTREKINPSNSKQAKAVKRNPINPSLLFVTDTVRRLFPRVVALR
jgi:hypothetical protein